jgi:hypothetical protein
MPARREAERVPSTTMSSTSLTVITPYFNPGQYVARRRNYARFAEHMRGFAGVRLLTVECAFGGRAFELERCDAAIQVRAEHPLWNKENLVNLGLRLVETPFVAWVDCDVLFQNRYWVDQSVAALQTYHVIQPWSTVHWLDSEGRKDGWMPSFCRVFHRRGYDPRQPSHEGFAWAARREVLEATGGLLEEAILGGADTIMSRAIFDADAGMWPRLISGTYRERVNAWCRKCSAAVHQNIGYVEGEIHHLFHGEPVHRQYDARHRLPPMHGYDPNMHLKKNADGVIQLVGLPALRDSIGKYFGDRLEDGPVPDRDRVAAVRSRGQRPPSPSGGGESRGWEMSGETK